MARRNARCSGRNDRPGRAGFTLIEVLVVVAIIALLIAILLPSLVMARNEAQAALCLSNLKQVSNGLQMHLIEQGMRRERISTNYGWATHSYRINKGAGKLFTCPADTNPKAVPPVLVDFYEGSTYHGRGASDGVFNRIMDDPALGNGYLVDIQDTVDGDGRGRDASGHPTTGDKDLVLGYSAEKGAVAAPVRVAEVESAWSFKVLNHKGQMVWDNPRGQTGYVQLPLMWLSYGANASAGLRSVKGNPILMIENRNPGCFPESLQKNGQGRQEDVLSQVLRFRHGPRLPKSTFKDKDDLTYMARERANAAFYDGHAERLPYSRIIGANPQVTKTGPKLGRLLWHRDMWLGVRPSDDLLFD
jgi:prepilin-type N-terminal cleavage/methylation domain-containing protein/prepilin-type processing-associated H-X9-DG protein